MWAPFILLGEWLATSTGIAVASGVTTLGVWYMFSDAMTDISANIFGDAEDPANRNSGTILAIAVLVGSVGFLVAKLAKVKV
jgi:hypothetical protein